MKKKITVLSIVALAVLLVVAGFLFFQKTYLVVDGGIYRRDTAELDLSGEPIKDLDKLAKLTALKHLDIQNTGISESDYRTLQSALPDCEILWSVPFQGSFYPLDTKQLSLTSLSQEEVTTLDFLPQLETVDATDCHDYDALLALQARHPECTVRYQVPLGTEVLAQDTRELTVKNVSCDQLSTAMAYLPDLQVVDASGSQELDGLLALQAKYPNCQIRYTVDIGGSTYRENTTQLSLENADARQVTAALPYFPQLTTVTFAGTAPTNEDIWQMKLLRPDVTFVWSFDLLGVTVSSQDTQIDLSRIPMETPDEVENALKYFNRLEKVILCNCGLSNEEMDALGQRNPDVRFVWTVSLGRSIRLRTDATYFMPYQFDTKVSDRDLVNLKYCVDLECMDLGHNPVSDASFLAYMPKMKYLLLADTSISDISGCANMPELIYAELFMTKVTDFSPLLNCKKLEDLNICYTTPNGIEDLRQMTWLKRLWLKGYHLTKDQQQTLRESLTGTQVVYGRGSSTGDGWRESQNYFDMRDLLGMSYMVG